MRPPIAGARYAFQLIHPGSPMLRIRYRRGVAVDPWGFPDWVPYARMLVELGPVPPGRGVDEARVADVAAANRLAAGTGDPLWTDLRTPAGWAWAHLANSRLIALVPVELLASYRHLGGVSTHGGDWRRRGLPVGAGDPPGIEVTSRLSDEALEKIELRLGYRLPAASRDFLGRTNGGRPARPAVHPRFGFVADQPFFGAARPDWLQDLVYANGWFTDRLTADWLAVGYVQGGLIAVRVAGGDEGSVWYLDDDDPRDHDGSSAAEVSAELPHRVAGDFASFWLALREIPAELRAAGAEASIVEDERLGTALPTAKRAA